MISYIPVEFDPFAEVNEIEKITLTNEPQREIWLSCIIGGNDANLSYNESVSLKITGTLDVAAFKKAVDNLVLRHEALRSTISPNGETLIIYKNLPLTFQLNDISGLGEPGAIDEFNTFLRAATNTLMDLQAGPLFRMYLHKTAEQEYYCTIIKHHIIGDGWSTGIMLEDLSKMYNAYTKGNDITLNTASQLSDYATAQSAFKLTKAHKDTENFWLNIYKDSVPVLNVPTDRQRPSAKTYKSRRIDYPISKEKAAQLKAVGAKQGCSLVTTLLAAFEVFLYQTTHQEDIVVGLPASGQAATGLTNVVGHCVNLLPLRTQIDTTLPFSTYLKKRKKEVLDAYDHQRFTFGELLKKLYIARDTSRIPLVPVIFNIDMGMDNSVAFDGLEFKLISNPREYENFEIYLNATGSKEGIIMEWAYNTDLFDKETIDGFNTSYDALLNKIIADPATIIADLAGNSQSSSNTDYTTDTDALTAPVVELDTTFFISPDRNIVTLLADAAKQYTDNVAVTFRDQSLTYKQLNEKTDQLASMLIHKGITGGDVVAICVGRSLEMLVSLIAVLKAGAAYLPLDPEYPVERTQFMLQDSVARLLITTVEHKYRYPSANKILVIDEVWASLNIYKKQKPKREILWSDVVYLLYTSGSTGKPKGVRITHKNMVNFLLSMQAAPGITEKDRLLAITSISFDIACLELYLPLVSGACVILADTNATKDGRMLIRMLKDERISILQGTPSTWQMLIDSGWDKRHPLRMFTGGEQLSKDLANKMLDRGDEIWNMYAPTETTIYSIIKHIEPKQKQITIGFPINNTRVYIMDEHGKPLPAGRDGEIYIGGDGVADGYWNRPELTAERFVADPYSQDPDARLYRTGDLGRMMDNGEILCLGRIDSQVKIRGHRIELGEIESILQQQKEIRQAVVIAREDIPGDKRLIGYVTLKDDGNDSDNTSWKDRWDTLYETGADNKQNQDAATANIDGTLLEGVANSAELIIQRDEWLETSIARIKELKARRIYEIGSGAGQISFALAPGIDYYMATDYAQAAITNINDRVAAEPQKWKHVHASVAAADDFSAIGNTPIDLVLINSVAQYFPNTDYMISVIRQAVNAVNKGCVFIGDMQGMNSLEMYHATDFLPRASADATLRMFRDVVANRVRIEEEFVADPSFFYMLPKLIPQITGVDVQLRKGQAINETTKYHYDIWLYVDTPVEVVSPKLTKDWKDIKTIDQAQALLNNNKGLVVSIKNILNSRTAKDYKLLQLLNSADQGSKLSDIRNEVAQVTDGIHPDLLWTLGDKLNYQTHIRWTTDGSDGLFDVVFIPASQQLKVPANMLTDNLDNIYDWARTPILNNELHVPKEISDNWKRILFDTLPAYMVPDNFVVLHKFPMTPNAKIDRKALPKPQPKKEQAKANARTLLTPNEQIITDIWREVLGLQELDPSDDFFQLGGHSLLAVKVMVAIEKKTGKRLPIATLFSNSTIEKLAAQIADEKKKEEVKWEAIVPIKTTGSKTPVFLIHGAGLNVLLFKSISEDFDADQPVYGIQALGLYHKTDIPATIEAISKRYIDEIIKVVPNGPYALAGYSMGGFIAYEMTRQLKAMGKTVEFLAMMDTYAGNNEEIDSKTGHLFKKVLRQFRKVPFYTKSFLSTPSEAWEYQKLVSKKRLQKMQDPGLIIPENIFTEYEQEILRTYDNALNNYILAPLDVKMVLFRVKKRLYFLDDLIYLGWGKFAKKGVTVHEVPGDHKTFLYPPNSKQFAHIMQKALDGKK